MEEIVLPVPAVVHPEIPPVPVVPLKPHIIKRKNLTIHKKSAPVFAGALLRVGKIRGFPPNRCSEKEYNKAIEIV